MAPRNSLSRTRSDREKYNRRQVKHNRGPNQEHTEWNQEQTECNQDGRAEQNPSAENCDGRDLVVPGL